MVRRITADLDRLSAAGVAIVSVGIERHDHVHVTLTRLDPRWVRQLRQEYGADLTFSEGAYDRLLDAAGPPPAPQRTSFPKRDHP